MQIFLHTWHKFPLPVIYSFYSSCCFSASLERQKIDRYHYVKQHFYFTRRLANQANSHAVFGFSVNIALSRNLCSFRKEEMWNFLCRCRFMRWCRRGRRVSRHVCIRLSSQDVVKFQVWLQSRRSSRRRYGMVYTSYQESKRRAYTYQISRVLLSIRCSTLE